MISFRDRFTSRCAVTALAASALTASALGAATDDQVARARAAVGLQDLQIVDVDVPAFDKEVAVLVRIAGEERELVLFPHSTRSPLYQVFVHDGKDYTEVEPAPSRTVRGFIEGEEDSFVAGSLLDDGLHALVQIDDVEYWVEPLSRWLDDADASAHAVYKGEDAAHLGGACGTPGEIVIDADADHRGEAGGIAAGGLCVTELGCDADFEYFQDWGSVAGVQNRINQVINAMNVQYETQCGITHEITTIIVRTSPGAPYTSSNPNTLLDQFQSEWFNNQGGVQRDVAKLFTGKNINGGVIGIAWTIGSICSNFSSYCLSESDFNGVFACATDLAAHELGHLWGAFHCNCPSNTMNSFITCANSFTQGSINSITNEINQSPCVDCGGPGGPENDNCEDAIAIFNGNTAYSTVGANTDGPPLPGACDEGFGVDFGSDIWYTYVPDCTGTLTVSTCDQANYDTRLAAYTGTCSNLTLVGCNDDGGGCGGFTSIMEVPVTCNVPVLIRVGGFAGDSGTGTLSVSCDGICDGGDEVELVDFEILAGGASVGGVAELTDSDNSYFVLESVTQGVRNNSLTNIIFQSPITSVSQLDFSIELGAPNVSPVFRAFFLFDYDAGTFVSFDFGIIPTGGDTVYTFPNVSNPNRFVSNTGEIIVRVGWTAREPQTPNGFTTLIDQVSVDVQP